MRLSANRVLAALLLLLAIKLPARAQTSYKNIPADPAMLHAHLQQADDQTRIDDPALKPWHLRISYNIYDDKRNPKSSGTIEEWWAGANQYKINFTSPEFTETELRSTDTTYLSGQAITPPYIEELMLREFVHPMPSVDEQEGATPVLRKEKLLKIDFECIMLTQPMRDLHTNPKDLRITQAPTGLFPTYCFRQESGNFLLSFDYGAEAIVRNRIASFQKRIIPLELSIAFGDHLVATAKIEALNTFTPTDGDFKPTSDMQSHKDHELASDLVKVAAGVIAGNLKTSVQPIYPQSAKDRHVSGTVEMSAVIGTDGQIHKLRLLHYDDADLALSAIYAVRQWKYSPYLLNGEAVSVDTTIKVIYNLN